MFQWLQRMLSGSRPASAPKRQPATPPLATNAHDAAGPETVPTAPTPAANCGISTESKDDVDDAYHSGLFGAPRPKGTPLNAVETEVLERLRGILDSPHPGADMIGRLPGVIPQLLQSLRSDNFSGAQLARTIESDVVLVAALIRLANSSALNTGKQIDSIEHAVILIGQKGLRHLITSIAFHPIIDPASGAYTRRLSPRILDQSERCAAANRTLAENHGVAPFDAFLAGLLQYAGLTASLRILDKADKDGKSLGSPLFRVSLLRDARQLTLSIAKELDFPPAVTQALGEQGLHSAATISPLGRLLALGDYLAKLRILVEAGHLTETDPRLFEGLAAEELGCYRQLGHVARQSASGGRAQ